MKRGAHDKTIPQCLKTLEDITWSYVICQQYTDAHHHFRVRLLNDQCVPNHLVSLDLMFLNKASVLHVVDVDTNLDAAGSTTGESTKNICFFVWIWDGKCIGYPDALAFDQEAQLTNST